MDSVPICSPQAGYLLGPWKIAPEKRAEVCLRRQSISGIEARPEVTDFRSYRSAKKGGPPDREILVTFVWFERIAASETRCSSTPETSPNLKSRLGKDADHFFSGLRQRFLSIMLLTASIKVSASFINP
uniref:Uncharacterized protein n=1 Tax=Rhodosorus marinus TaxID=101924 RepID=A0A7S3E8V7_9RHOD|mmetsp:Transcript_14962/g.60995  ORF Transcript_14962/g.60995 Transcript_14962/m.60995 type:complete len:129 (+) Transcript_14962:508-894(+)